MPARAALAGHPSDGFGGAVLAVPVRQLSATVSVAPGDGCVLGDLPLARAAIARLARYFGRDADSCDVMWETTIPRSCGLAGSSALVIATLRAAAAHWGRTIPDEDGPALALAVEVDDLGITAGPQDRIVQWHEQPLLMELGGHPWIHTVVHPPAPIELFVCWTSEARRPSGAMHATLRAHRDEPAVRTRMSELAVLAREAADALSRGDVPLLRRCVDEGFEHRRALVPLEPAHVALVDGLRALGAAATYTGSGGAAVALADDLQPLRDWAIERGLGCVVTTVA